MTNAEISDLFALLAKLMDIHNENSFKAKSYANAAFTIDKLPEQLKDTDRNEIQYLRGIGDSTAKKIIEILDHGQLGMLNDLIAKTPPGILELLKIKGIGPKKISQIWKELGIESPGELLYACNENRLLGYKGFGEKSQNSIRESLEFFFSNQQRWLYAQLEPIARALDFILGNLFGEEWVRLVGDFARQEDVVDHLVFVIAADSDLIKKELSQLQGFTFQQEEYGKLIFLYQTTLPLHLFMADEESFATLVFTQSGTAEFVDAFQEAYAIDFTREIFADEEEIFAAAERDFIPVFARRGKSFPEVDIKTIISESDIRGVIHCHSTWSDGKNTIAEMANACIEKGYEYLVMSDHSVTSFYANGLSTERIVMQHQEIDELNKKIAPFKIFKSIECDILQDGRLDYDDAVLASFDLVIASIHQNLKMSEEKAMERLLAAVANPYTQILCHPSGRLLLSRKEYPVNYEQLIAHCKKHDVAIEINANPRRLDIDWQWISHAINAGVKLSINPDAHSIKGIDDIHFGVISAQKGLLTAGHNVSSLTLTAFEEFIKRKN